jgi:cell division protein FtsQ
VKRPEGFDPPRPGEAEKSAAVQAAAAERATRLAAEKRAARDAAAQKGTAAGTRRPDAQDAPPAVSGTAASAGTASAARSSGVKRPIPLHVPDASAAEPAAGPAAEERSGASGASSAAESAKRFARGLGARATGSRSAAASAASAVEAGASDRSARAALRRAERERRRFERGEVRRFTRRSRNRRRVWLSIGSVVAVLAIVLAVAVYSPLLALRTVTVDGTSRVSAEEVVDAVEEQVGTPLALLDYGRITDELAEFPLIRSYVTETVPPHELVIHIVERQPVGAVADGEVFDLVDPAGIVVQSTPERPEGVPIINLPGNDPETPAYRSVVEVLLALPVPVLAEVDSITATTKDNVSFVLRGVGQSVVWGSADNSDYKARVLAAMIGNQDAETLVEYDVSAPGSVVVTPK